MTGDIDTSALHINNTDHNTNESPDSAAPDAHTDDTIDNVR
jgi:hypothetical protein